MIRLIFLYFFLLPKICHAAISILSWQENTSLTDYGKRSQIIIQGQVKNISDNQFLSSFSIGFDQKRKMTINQLICDNKSADYSFINNTINIKFGEDKKNNSVFLIALSYDETYDEINKFLRQEAIYIPSFAAKAQAQVTIHFPDNLESATLNPNVTKIGNSFVYRNNIVPAKGVSEMIKLTPTQTIWNLITKTYITSNKPLGNIKITTPIYFKNGRQKIENIVTTANIEPSSKITNKDNVVFNFNTEQNQILINNKARIYAQATNNKPTFRDPQQYLTTTQEEVDLLSPILDQITQNPKYKNLPLYAQIGKFTHDFIKYDINYAGKLPKIREIIQNPIGVCTEYANLYNALARLAKIPAIVISGAACGEYRKCQGHAWNMIYYDNKWIEVDPTWDLMSGLVSSSHVYFNDSDKGEVQFEYVEDPAKIVNYKLDFEMKEAL